MRNLSQLQWKYAIEDIYQAYRSRLQKIDLIKMFNGWIVEYDSIFNFIIVMRD